MILPTFDDPVYHKRALFIKTYLVLKFGESVEILDMDVKNGSTACTFKILSVSKTNHNYAQDNIFRIIYLHKI